MAKFGKLELADDSDEDTEIVRVVSKRKRAVETIIISSDEEEDDPSDLTSLSPSPAPVRRRFLGGDKDASKKDNAAERVQATGDFSGSTGRSLLDATNNRDNEDATVSEGLAQNETSPPSVQKKVPKDRKEEELDNDSVYEIPPPVQARNIRAEATSMKKIPYNKPSKNSLIQSSTILATGFKPGNPLVHTPSAPSSSRMHAPHLNGDSSTFKQKQAPPPKLTPRRSQKQSDITSWNQSKRVQPAPTRPLLLPKHAKGHPDSRSTVKAPAPSEHPGSTVSPFPFTNKALLTRLKHPGHSSSTEDDSLAVPLGSTSTGFAPSPAPAKLAEIETGLYAATPEPATKPREDADVDTNTTSDASSGSSEGNEDAPSTTPPTEQSRLSADHSTPDQHTYILTSEYDRQLYRAVESHWAPFARMRQQLANARLPTDKDDESDVSSESEGDVHLATGGNRWYGGLGHGRGCSCRPGNNPCTSGGGCILLQDPWILGEAGVRGIEMTREEGNVETQREQTHSTEENVSVASAMRRYVERFWSAGSNLPSIWASAPLPEDGQASGVGEQEDDRMRILLPESPRLTENHREGSYDPPTPSSNVQKLPRAEVTPSLPGDNSTVPLDTPTTQPSTAATLVNATTSSKKSTSPSAVPLAPLKPTLRVSQPSTPAQRTVESAATNDASHSHQPPAPYDFSYESTAMHIGSASWDKNSFAMIRSTATNPQSFVQPDSPIQVERSSPTVTSYRPTRHFLGVEPPRIPGTKKYALYAVRGLMEGRESIVAEESSSDVEDLSESELNPDALALYQAIRFYQEHLEEDLEPAKGNRKRKAVKSGSSAPEEEPDYEEYVGRKKKVQRVPRKRRKYSQTTSQIDSGSPLPISIPRPVSAARYLRIRATGTSLAVPVGLGVDDIDPSCIRIRQVRDVKVTTTALCHQCRCQNTGTKRKAQCGNVTVYCSASSPDTPSAITTSVRCNKTFCERCLRGWYGFDDDAIAFVGGGQQITEGKGTGTGIGIGIVEGIWICPSCISLCMCTVCSRKRKVERTKYAPSANAVIAVVTSRTAPYRPRVNSGNGTRQKTHRNASVDAAEDETQPLSSTPLPLIRLPRRIGPPPVPTQWLPEIPTPTPGLDPIYYEATRPCTRDFPTGAPQPTAANHAPIVYHVGADLENDGHEDSFTGSEMSEAEVGGEGRPSDHSARFRSKSNNLSDPSVPISSAVVQPTRKNFLIVTPGRRMPSTTKKRQELIKEPISSSFPTLRDPLMPLKMPDEPAQTLDGMARFSLESPLEFYADKELSSFDPYPATVDPMHLSGSASSSHAQKSPTQSSPTMFNMVQAASTFSSRHHSSPRSEDGAHPSSGDDNNDSVSALLTPYFDDYETHPNDDVPVGSPALAIGEFNDFLPIMGGDDDVSEGVDLLVDTDGDTLMEDGIFSLLLLDPSSHEDPETPSQHDVDIFPDDLLGETSMHF